MNDLKLKNRKMAILIISHSSYCDVLEISMKMMRKYWSDCPYSVILSSNQSKFNDENVFVINVGENASWSDRVRRAIQEVHVDYFLLMNEDMIITDTVNNRTIEEILEKLCKYKFRYYKIIKDTYWNGKKVEGEKGLYYIPKHQIWGIDLMASIWEREYLLERISLGESSWELEEAWNEYGMKQRVEDYADCVVDERNVLFLLHGVIKGKWFRRAVWVVKKSGIYVNLEKRGVLSIGEEVKVFIRNSLYLIPIPVRKKLKSLLSKFGFKFKSEF